MDGFDNFNQNPFEKILQTAQAGQQTQPQGATPGDMQNMQPQEHQLMQGKNPDNSQPLMAAIKALQQFITNSSSSVEIATARSIISLISRLVDRTQRTMVDKLPQDEQISQQ